MRLGIAVSTVLVAGATMAQADTLKLNFYNYHQAADKPFQTVFVSTVLGNKFNETGYDNSLNGTLNGTKMLPTLFCFDLFQSFNAGKLPTSFTVTVTSQVNEEAWTIEHAKSLLSGLVSGPRANAEIDAATQLAVWEEEYGNTVKYSAKDSIDKSLASALVADSAGHTAYAMIYTFNDGRPGTGGQSMIGTPGPAAFAPFAIGLMGLLRKRRTA